jgi:hypothetical protein
MTDDVKYNDIRIEVGALDAMSLIAAIATTIMVGDPITGDEHVAATNILAALREAVPADPDSARAVAYSVVEQALARANVGTEPSE